MNLDKHRLTKNILMAAIMGASSVQVVVPPSLVEAANSVVANDTVPVHGEFITGGSGIINANGDIKGNLSVSQTGNNAVIKWNDFSIGANATVDFSKLGGGEFSTLNYVKNGGDLSQIYGTINANEGNIFIVNPAGVEIGNSAQINVGSLYVSNKNLTDDQLKSINPDGDIVDINKVMGKGIRSGAELMSLGNINATNVTFDGDRIVLDTERVKNGSEKLGAGNITIKTTQTAWDNNDVVLGYDAYDDTKEDGKNYPIGYAGKNTENEYLATIEGVSGKDNITKKDGYMWVKNGIQLQAINTNKSGNYAFRNSMDLNSTAQNDFYAIGNDKNEDNKFTGKVDGLGFDVYGLNITSKNVDNTDSVGLFGATDGALIRNFNLISGSVTGKENVGAVVGNAKNTTIENVTNTLAVTGDQNVGGIIGSGENVTLNNVKNTGAISGNENAVIAKDETQNVGGLAGSLSNSTLKGESYNLGNVEGISNVGGLVGEAKENTIIGNALKDEKGDSIKNEDGSDPFQIYNHLDVTGDYNVGGIVGSMENSTVQNVSNDGNVTATGYTEDKYNYHTGETDEDKLFDATGAILNGTLATLNVKAANVGGITGNSVKGTFDTVVNEGDISSKYNEGNNTSGYYYEAGNVGGVVGRAEDTNITDATNKEANIRGAHNVGGIAGYFGNSEDVLDDTKYTIRNGINNGGDILATGARLHDSKNFAKEIIRPNANASNETFIIGNIGGIVGYMYGDNTHITQSANRGTVHTAEITDSVKDSSKAANVGGIVGKIDRENTNTLDAIKKAIENDEKYKEENNLDVYNEKLISETAVSNSYNTGNVSGYTGVGGVVGMMYNGEVAGSYNLGTIKSTRTATGDSIEPLNMGGIVGDTTEQSSASVSIYDVYNKGQIGDEEFNYYGRHVGGIVGRLSGDVEKAYNNGAIYNGFTTVGGIAGWWVDGSINNVFNTGNITVNNKSNDEDTTSEVGGIAGAVEVGTTALSNAYNLGTIRSFKAGKTKNRLGGIIGNLQDFYNQNKDNNLSISNVYTLGNLYVNEGDINSIIGGEGNTFIGKTTITNAYYIAPEKGSGFTDLTSNKNNNANQTIAYEKRLNLEEYAYEKDGIEHHLGEKENNTGIEDETFNNSVDESYDWRIYGGKTTPILNAFIPDSEKYFSNESNKHDNISSIQYGTAYDPLLTIINAKGDVNFDWQKLGMSGDAGLAVYGGGLTLTNFANLGGTGFFGGVIYADNALNISGDTDIRFGSSSQIYGSSVDINTNGGDLESYGNIIATGNKEDADNQKLGDISLSGDNVNIYGKLQSANGKETSISGVEDTAHKHGNMTDAPGGIKNPKKAMTAVEERYTHKVTSNTTGDITVTANNGDANIYYGNEEKGIVDTNNLTVNANKGNVYIDSDMKIGGNLSANANDEIVVDISNVGKVDTTQTVHDFLHGFDKNEQNNSAFNLISENDNAKITVDLWDDNDKEGKYNFKKYDTKDHTLMKEIDNLRINVKNGSTEAINPEDKIESKDIVYIWVEDGDQLKDIQQAAEDTNDTNGRSIDILSYNFALKNDINATGVENYESIGKKTGADNNTAFTGIFDGRDNRIIGLTVEAQKAEGANYDGSVGVFGVNEGTIKNLKVYSSNITGLDNVGGIVGINNGTVENVTTLGNTVTSTGSDGSYKFDETRLGVAGGIVGQNNGTITDATSRDSVIANEQNKPTAVNTTAGGIAGVNNAGATIENSETHSAVTASKNNTEALGGIAGINYGLLNNVNSFGVTSGIYGAEGTADSRSDNIGGIVGINIGEVKDAYNESIVEGKDTVGGIAGSVEGGTITNVANASSITGIGDYTGGIAGQITGGSINSGRNSATITGENYVGGLVGANGEKDKDEENKNIILTNLTNDSSANIKGTQYVGGIAGQNNATITAADQSELINRGTITGNQYVGGVAGENNGTIDKINSNMTLTATGNNAQFFGGVAGANNGTINDATNAATVTAEGASYVGGIVGQNNGILSGNIGNTGNVKGKDYVGGVAGQQNNTNDISGTEDEHRIFTNSGTVEAEEGGAGGIFGENTGNLTYVEITNSGTVTGTDGSVSGTGGLIGVNSGNIKYSSLKNEVGGNVSGVNNVGGLIGVNKGEIEGGRTEDDGADVGYYKYQIYNNGTITGTGSGFNIGGLIGENQAGGSLTAGYNTGAISAENSTNVGGIIGNNAGTVDQVFNTIMNKDGSEGSVTGKKNVGGLIGTNRGTLSNAYNTSKVEGTNAGNAIGNNTGKAKNIYATKIDGVLIGSNNGEVTSSYSFSPNDKNKEKNGITYLENDKEKDKESYKFVGEDGKWKFYDGNTSPLLKVFLTKVEVTDPGFEYNGYEQGFNVSADNHSDLNGIGEVTNGHLTDLSGQKFAAQANSGYNLIHANKHTNANTYDDWLYSDQIKSGGTGDTFNPNNLGYDIEYKSNDDIKIKKATIIVTGSDVEHMYGSADIINNTDYSITSVTNSKGEKIKDWNKYFTLGKDSIKDTALTGNTTGKITNDVSGDYEWTGNVNVDDSIKTNLKNADSLKAKGNSKVIRAGLIINVNDEQILEGETPNYTGKVSGLVNGDTESILGNHQYGVENPDIEMQVGTHKGDIGIWIGNTFYKADNQGNVNLKNYTVKINPGTLTVTPIIHPEDDKRNWNNLLNDAPWDRNRDFRERKAEFNYTDGGVAIEKNDEDIVVEA